MRDSTFNYLKTKKNTTAHLLKRSPGPPPPAAHFRFPYTSTVTYFRFPYTSTVTFKVLRASTDTGHTQIQQSAQVHRINHKPDRSAEAKSY